MQARNRPETFWQTYTRTRPDPKARPNLLVLWVELVQFNSVHVIEHQPLSRHTLAFLLKSRDTQFQTCSWGKAAILWINRKYPQLNNELSLQYLPLRKKLRFTLHSPAQRIFPSAMMAIRSPSISASSMKWVERRIEHFLLYCWITSQMARRAAGSIPAVGSSRITH